MLAALHGLFVEPLMRIYGLLLDIPPIQVGMGGRIVFFSVLLNLLLAPVYYEMEKRSRLTRALKQRVGEEVARMRRYYKGRERYFYIRAVHRQHGYHPLSHLAGSADLLVQVVVFFTVYQYLSGLDALVGASFGPLTDLSRADGLLGGINLLPFVMTLINIGSVFAYSQDRAHRVQALLLAGLFLVLLYASPAGLVLYWTTNNLFSLARNYLLRRLADRPIGNLRRQAAELRQQS
jgi:membrane protein insertase Oxa1/YidC/SpoIIIJ